MSIDTMLKGHDLFRSLSVEETHRISDFSKVRTYAGGEVVFEFGSQCFHIFMLMDGLVDLRLPANPPEYSFVISKIEKGELFGLSPLFDSRKYTSTALCREKTEVLSIEAKPFRELLQKNHLAGFNIMSQVARIYFGRYIDVLKNLQAVVSQIPLIR